MDSLSGWVKIDMIWLIGFNFEDVDNCLFSFWLVKYKFIEVVMFGFDGRNIYGFEFFYWKNVLVVRGSFCLVILVNMDMIWISY